ncbi:hypothetical protein F3Y22_tig00116962pilonHSYRG00824 [Hibiscus syriacus]|uniref:DUF641 domain-containing protein n=1 Tax=Hibiscus syriacus TaxID=106335 RepID=A0A6A2WJF3_HIBSY|nr:hypothetical protein F3Y22_tig00116962pilonHSYRG00824 [Hibiscus syriacus]
MGLGSVFSLLPNTNSHTAKLLPNKGTAPRLGKKLCRKRCLPRFSPVLLISKLLTPSFKWLNTLTTAIQASDQALVEELRALSELKRKFLKKELDLSPQVTLMLAEIQEQQSLTRTYEITIKNLKSHVEEKDSDIALLHKQLQDCTVFNKSLVKKLNASEPLSMFDDVQIATLNPSHFLQVLHFSLRSARSFVKLMVREMELAKWDVVAAAETIEPGAVFAKESHRCFAFESFVCKTMSEGFNSHDFGLTEDSLTKRLDSEQYFNAFKNLKSAVPKSFLAKNPNSCFAKFIRTKYLHLVHSKMECSFLGNLNQRKVVTSSGFPDTAFFTAFAEMSRRFWLLHCLGFSMQEQVSIFQVKKGCGFSVVYLENVSDESLLSGEINGVLFLVTRTARVKDRSAIFKWVFVGFSTFESAIISHVMEKTSERGIWRRYCRWININSSL